MVRERAVATRERRALAQANEDILTDVKAAGAFKQAAAATGAVVPADENLVKTIVESKGVGRFQE
jgi:hypothetical protein